MNDRHMLNTKITFIYSFLSKLFGPFLHQHLTWKKY
jgi:hypothetical protein